MIDKCKRAKTKRLFSSLLLSKINLFVVAHSHLSSNNFLRYPLQIERGVGKAVGGMLSATPIAWNWLLENKKWLDDDNYDKGS